MDKTYDPSGVEARWYEAWEKAGAFACRPDSNAQPYTIMMPPPNVTGSLHMGHALTFTLQDVLIRYRRMTGRDALWQPGTDHAGIATQMVVERQLADQGKSKRDLGRETFVERVWAWKEESGGTITRQLRRLGASPDWARERFTMDEGLSQAVRKVFVDLHKQGLIYRDKRLVNWDPKMLTAISDLEVVQKEVKGHLWHVRYPIEGESDRWIVVATTRPETMLGDTAIAVHPDDERWKPLVGKRAILPLVGRRIPIVADEYSDPEKGSGAVKITPAHDFNDFEVGKRHGLLALNVLDASATMRLGGKEFAEAGGGAADGRWGTVESAVAAFDGKDRFAVRKLVVARLEEMSLIEKVEPHAHMVPHGDRGGVPIEPFLTTQWYCDAKTLAQGPIKAVEDGRTRFVPQQWENTFFEWMRNIQPWCISRQLWWGHQIPAWYGPDGEVFVAMTEAEAAAAARARYGKDVALKRDEDVLDTWFSSALWPFSTLGWPERTRELDRYYPGDVLVTGFDIIFFWVARMMMMGMHFMGDVPFRTVYIHALVRDQHGQKMSKSKGNIIDPLELIDRYGADALRFTLAALAAQGRDVKLAEGRVEGYRNFATKLWNAARFCEVNGCKPDPAYDPARARHTVNRWIVAETAAAGARATAALEAFKYNEAANALYQFTWGSFCDWYLEFAKPILLGNDPGAAAEARATAAWVLDRVLHLLHPLMPSITEEIWASLGLARPGALLIKQEWPRFPETGAEAGAAQAEMGWVIELVSAVRAARMEVNVPPAALLPLVLQDADPTATARALSHRELICRLARLSGIESMSGKPPGGSLQVVVAGATAVLPIAGVVDIAKERARLEKERAKAAGDMAKIDAKLANADFLKNAPEEEVEKQSERRDALRATVEKVRLALERLDG